MPFLLAAHVLQPNSGAVQVGSALHRQPGTIASGAGVTVAGIRVPKEQSDQFGVIQTAADGRTIERFVGSTSKGANLLEIGELKDVADWNGLITPESYARGEKVWYSELTGIKQPLKLEDVAADKFVTIKRDAKLTCVAVSGDGLSVAAGDEFGKIYHITNPKGSITLII